MFDRFSEPARKAMSNARKEAQALGHDFIGTEHVVLGLLAVPEGRAAEVLKDMGKSTSAIRAEVEKRTRRGTANVAGQLPFTPQSKNVLEAALEEAEDFKHSYIGTEHLLLGALRVERGIGAAALRAVGVEVAEVRRRVQEKAGGEIADEPTRTRFQRPEVRPSRVCTEALQSAFEAAVQSGHHQITTRDLLLALARAGKGDAARVLSDFGITPDALEERFGRDGPSREP